MVYPTGFKVDPRPSNAAYTALDEMNTIRVLIADDHALVRESIRAILANQGDMEIVATASDGNEAVQMAMTHQPDVVVMDISMPSMDGLHATELIHRAQEATNIIILSMHVNAALVQQALRMGARGYVLKRRATDELPAAIRAAVQGKTFLSTAIPPSFLPR
jgi:DNA-binding NarL/FixJ family response regulator